MATEDLNKKNTPKKKLDEERDEETTTEKNEVSSAQEGTGTTDLITEPTPGEIKELTPEELEEKSIDEEETESLSTKDCRCQEIDGEYYCFRLKQGGWIQWSVIPYPTKRICEAACCGE